MIRKGKKHMIVNSPALPRNQLSVDDEKCDSVLSASQVKLLARKGARVFLAVIRLVESGSVPPVVDSVAALSPDVPTTSVQPDQPAGPPGGELPWVSGLSCEFFKVFQILCHLVCPLNVQKGTVSQQSQDILRHYVTLDEIRCSSTRRVQNPRLAFQQT
jgi:hypothetical protein